MKKLLLSIVLIAFANSGYSQLKIDSATNLDEYYIDFAIPDMSAFGLLGISPNEIQKPSNLKEFSAGIAGLNSKGKINPGVALEWSPLYTTKKTNISIANYRKEYLLYALQLTGATNSDSTGTNMAIGLKWTPINKVDPLLDENYANDEMIFTVNTYNKVSLTMLDDTFKKNTSDLFKKYCGIGLGSPVANAVTIYNTAQEHIATLNESQSSIVSHPEKLFDTVVQYFKANNIDVTTIDTITLRTLSNEYISLVNFRKKTAGEITAHLKESKAKFLASRWNAQVLQFSCGYVLNSPNGTWSTLLPKKFVGFAGFNQPLGKSGEVIIQAKYSKYLNSDTGYNQSFSGGARLLIGSSNTRVSLEGSYQYYEPIAKNALASHTFRTTLGIEFKVSTGIWLEAATGINQSISHGETTSPIGLGTIKYAFTQKRRFDLP